MRRTTLTILTTTALVLVTARAALSATTYNVSIVGSVGVSQDKIQSQAALNSAGDVAGTGYPTTNFTTTNAFITDYTTGQRTYLPTLGGSAYAAGINSSGQVTGDSDLPGINAPQHAFLYSNGTTIDIAPAGTGNSQGYAINDSGQVAGTSFSIVNNAPQQRGFIYSNGVSTTIGTLGGTYSAAYAINASGQMTGISSLAGDMVNHPFLWTGGVMQDLGTLGGTQARGLGINAQGDVVGYSALSGTSADHAFLYSHGAMHDLGTLDGTGSSYANGINDLGQIVGESSIGNSGAGFIYSNGVMTDLNSLISPALGLKIDTAWAINNSSQILVAGETGTGAEFVALLTPNVPEPGTFALLFLGLGVLAIRSVRGRAI